MDMEASKENTFATGRQPNLLEKWWFTCVLLISYIGIFNVWLLQEGSVAGSGAVYVMALSLLTVFAWKRSYFAGNYDLFFHASVILDVFLEATYITAHHHVGFYLCALGFGIVVGGYRFMALKKRGANLTQRTV
jgi:hypothetical protein